MAERIEDVNVRRASQLRVFALVAYYGSDWHMAIQKVFAKNVARVKVGVVYSPGGFVVAVDSVGKVTLSNDLHNVATLWLWVFWVRFWTSNSFSRPANINASKIKPHRKVISLLGVDGHHPVGNRNQLVNTTKQIVTWRRCCVAIHTLVIDWILEQHIFADVLGFPCVYGHEFAALMCWTGSEVSPRFAKAAALCVVATREQ